MEEYSQSANQNEKSSIDMDRSLYVKIPTWRKFTYGGIELANQFSWTLISSFLMVYLTDTFLIPIKVSIMFFLMGVAWYGVLSVEYYWFIYVLGDGQYYGTVNILGLGASIFGCFIAPYFARKFKSKSAALILAFSLFAICNTAFYFVFSLTMSHLLANISVQLCTIFISFGNSMLYGLLPDTVEYSELISDGLRMDGFLNTLASFWNKVGITLGTAATGWILEAAGYQPNLAQQSDLTIQTMNALRWLMPGIAGVLIVIVCCTYRLNFERFNQVVSVLQEKRKTWEN